MRAAVPGGCIPADPQHRESREQQWASTCASTQPAPTTTAQRLDEAAFAGGDVAVKFRGRGGLDLTSLVLCAGADAGGAGRS